MSNKIKTVQKRHVDQDRSTAGQFRELAKKEYEREGTLEIDEGAAVSLGDDGGAYVAAWVWVYGEVCRTCGIVFKNGGGYNGECEGCAGKAESRKHQRKGILPRQSAKPTQALQGDGGSRPG